MLDSHRGGKRLATLTGPIKCLFCFANCEISDIFIELTHLFAVMSEGPVLLQ